MTHWNGSNNITYDLLGWGVVSPFLENHYSLKEGPVHIIGRSQGTGMRRLYDAGIPDVRYLLIGAMALSMPDLPIGSMAWDF